jgi:hypothetical protein
MAGALAPHVTARQKAELVVDDRREPIERIPVAVAPGSEQTGRVAGKRRYRFLMFSYYQVRPIVEIIPPVLDGSNKCLPRGSSSLPPGPTPRLAASEFETNPAPDEVQ